ncbi:MAG TPA: hypothetical protein VKA70_02740 [Blastocatellia bacterium]|nr:hypothetical protein [Blastocatellia bacterium]
MINRLKPLIIIIMIAGLAAAQTAKGGRPLTKRGTIGLEGAQQRFTFKLFDSSKASLPLPFTTYVPQDMLAETASSGEGDAVTFISNFDGERNDNAFLSVYFYPQAAREDGARELAKEVASSRGIQQRRSDSPKRFRWSLAEHDFMNQTKSGEWVMGTVALGKHKDRFFHVIISYPENYEEGFVPRAYRVLDEWRWAGGQRL